MNHPDDAIRVLFAAVSPASSTDAAERLGRADDRFVVETVTDPDAGLAAIQRASVDCVVAVATVDGRGLAFLETARGRFPDIPGLLYVSDEYRDAARDSDGDDSPVSDALAAGVTDVVDPRRERDAVPLLANRVANAVEASRAANERDRQRERLQRFVSGVSHDLRNPLNVAQGRLAFAREECDSDHLDTASTAVDRTLELIGDLLALAKQGEMPTELETVDLAAIAEESWSNVATMDATLVLETDQQIRAHPSRLKQLLANLFGNAVAHGGDDVSVVVGAVNPMYTTTRTDDPVATGFYVADDGPGIPERERERVFEVGYTTDRDGTGFGLNIVQEVAAAHGWDVRVTEGAYGGARFEVTGVDVE